jgi:hypothetical protein
VSKKTKKPRSKTHEHSASTLPDTHDECVVPLGHIPAQEITKYSPIRDPDAEQDIVNYMRGQARDETVEHVERVKTEYVLGDSYEVWDVTTDKGRWWVITNLTNLYSQEHFKSLDYTLSFHIGLMMRLRSRPQGADANDPDPFDEVFRRQEQAKDRYDRAVEAEDYQAVGMQLRECLISLASVLRRRVEIVDLQERPKDADFVNWMDVLMNRLCPSSRNEKLRQYMKTTSEKTWQLVNWLTHDRDANDTASSIAIHACDTVVGHSVQLLMREKMDHSETCPRCLSRNIRTHFDIDIEPDGAYYNTCSKCNWTSHPGAAKAEP